MFDAQIHSSDFKILAGVLYRDFTGQLFIWGSTRIPNRSCCDYVYNWNSDDKCQLHPTPISIYIYIYIAYNRYYCFYLLVFNKIIQNYVKPLLIILFYFNPIRIYDEFVVRFIAITLNTRLTICKHLIKGEIIQTSNLYDMTRFAWAELMYFTMELISGSITLLQHLFI